MPVQQPAMAFFHLLKFGALFRGEEWLYFVVRLAKDLVDVPHRLIASRLQLKSGAIDYG